MAKSNDVGAIPYEKENNVEISLFQTQGRITRKAFFFRLILCVVVWLIFHAVYVCWVASYYWEYIEIDSDKIQIYKIIDLYVIPCIFAIFILIQSVKRVHDVNLSGWFLLVPFYNLYLILVDGTDGNNSYGLHPYAEKKNPKYLQTDDETIEETPVVVEGRRKWLWIVLVAVLVIGGSTTGVVMKKNAEKEKRIIISEAIKVVNDSICTDQVYHTSNHPYYHLFKDCNDLDKNAIESSVWQAFESGATNLCEICVNRVAEYRRNHNEANNFKIFADDLNEPKYYHLALEWCNKALQMRPDNIEMLKLKKQIQNRE
ncbi:MAG: DUF805 domain-containing protein [Planctomycetaceae bacterium]|jgi:uncharacterized membrane protein YhaH (DUF805 family)|nr:DUF805 domain-containing protein [Planctomycetaceae bacterium]